MRNFLAVILAIIAGITASFGLVSWKLSELIHRPEPVQAILGSGPEAEEFKTAVPGAVGNLATDTTGVALVDDALNQAISETSARIVSHENFDAAWSESLEQTRVAWLDDITGLRERMEAGEPISDNSTEAQLDLQLGPVTNLTLSMIEDAVSEAIADLPGVEAPSLQLEDDAEISVATSIPPVSLLTAEQVVMVEELMTMWPAILALAAIIFVMALVVASWGSRWIVWLLTGLMVAVCGAAIKLGYMWMKNSVVERAEGDPNLTLVRPLLDAVQSWADPQLLVMVAAAIGMALLGILGGFISANRRRSYRSAR